MGTSRKGLEISTKVSDMSFASSFQTRVGLIAQFVAPNRPLKHALPSAAAFIGLGARRVRALWGKEARSIGVKDEAAIEAAEARIAEHILTKEVSRHAYRLELYAARLATMCDDTHGEEINRLRLLARRARRLFDRDGEA